MRHSPIAELIWASILLRPSLYSVPIMARVHALKPDLRVPRVLAIYEGVHGGIRNTHQRLADRLYAVVDVVDCTVPG